ncbi:MAG: hypothetical protein QOF60_299 [Actinomycetota bacterium]|nr:hypothetical protein [Actinomycetota bacterium]
MELTTVRPILVLATNGCAGDPAYLVPAFAFATAGQGEDATGPWPVSAVADAEVAKTPTTTVPTADCAGLPPEEQRPVP